MPVLKARNSLTGEWERVGVNGEVPITDQTYKPESENAQSGKAVAEAITNSTLAIKGVIGQLEYGATSGLYIVRTDTVQAKLKNGDRFIIEVTGTKLSTDAYVYVDFNYATKITTFDLIYPQTDGLAAKRFKIIRGNWTSDSGIVEKDTITEETITISGLGVTTPTENSPNTQIANKRYVDNAIANIPSGGSISIDQTYKPKSENAQSGIAVAQAIAEAIGGVNTVFSLIIGGTENGN